MIQTPSALSLTTFAMAWAVGIYVVNCLIARRVIRVDIKEAALHIAAMAMLGVIGEVAIGSFYKLLFHSMLWHYTVLPVHGGYTSEYALFLWGIYGFHLYLLHGTLRNKLKSLNAMALLFCFEAIIIELLVNLTFVLSFGQFIFYYNPTDLWHFTSIQTLPFYLAAGYIVLITFREFELDKKFFIPMSMAIACVIAFAA